MNNDLSKNYFELDLHVYLLSYCFTCGKTFLMREVIFINQCFITCLKTLMKITIFNVFYFVWVIFLYVNYFFVYLLCDYMIVGM